MTSSPLTLRVPFCTLALALISLSLDLGCGGRKSSVAPPVDHVYVAGLVSTGIVLGDSIPNQAMLWVDGKATPLSPGSPSFAIALSLSGSDMLVAGKDQGTDNTERVVIWRNGTAVPLATGPVGKDYPTSIATSGSTVAVGGHVALDLYGRWAPCTWLNGTLQTQQGIGTIEAVTLSDGKITAAGWLSERVELAPLSFWIRSSPLSWHKDSATRLTTGITGGEGRAVQVSGGDVYVAGVEYRWDMETLGPMGAVPMTREETLVSCTNKPKAATRLEPLASSTGGPLPGIAAYWKNGKAVYLSDGARYARATAICVSGSDVFVAGLQQVNDTFDAAVYWKNGVRVPLTGGKSEARTTGIAVVGSDVYVSGYEVINGICVATYWKNGEAVRLSDGKNDGFAQGIVVQRVP